MMVINGDGKRYISDERIIFKNLFSLLVGVAVRTSMDTVQTNAYSAVLSRLSDQAAIHKEFIFNFQVSI